MWSQHPDIARKWTDEQKRKGAPQVVGKLSEYVASERALAMMHGKAQMAEGGFTRAEAKRIAKLLDLDFSQEDFTLADFTEGLNVELEHADVTKKRALATAKIALAHLRERGDYYRRLRRVESDMHGKSKGTLVSNIGASPAPYDAIPDYGDIYYQPDDDPRREDESTARETRRVAMGVANRGKYGFHGTADAEDTPLLRYESDDFPQNQQSQHGPSPNKRAEAIVQPNRYPQSSVKTGPVKHVVQRDKMFGRVGTGEPKPRSSSPGRRPKGGEGAGEGVRFSETNEAMHSHKPKPQKNVDAPSATTPKMIGDEGATQPTVRDDKKVRYVASTQGPRTTQRMGR